MNIQSESIEKIVEALAKAQSQIEVVVYDSNNPHFKSKYASYEAIRSACKMPLADNGLTITHLLAGRGADRVIITQLSHISGQWMRSYLSIPQAEKESPQQMGSLITYSKRYTLSALLALSSDEDDDAEKAEGPYRKAQTTAPVKPSYSPMPEFQEEEDTLTVSRPPEGVYTFPFGKHAGKPLSEVPQSYFKWLVDTGALDQPQHLQLAIECRKLGLI
jgi:hypothetical protein